MTLLNVVIFLPLIAFLIILAVPKDKPEMVRVFSLIASLAVFVVSLGLIGPVWSSAAGTFALETNRSWIQSPAINYHVGLDGISLWLVMLSTLLTPICVLLSWRSIDKHIKQFFAFLLLLEFGLIGVFCALDFFLFFVFWEVSLVPMYFLIGVWGHERRIYSAVKFFVYTMAGSMLMLVGIIYLYNLAGTFDYTTILAGLQSGAIALSPVEQLWLFLAGFCDVEDGHLRTAPLLRPDVSKCRPHLRGMDCHAGHHWYRVWRASGDGAAEHEEAGGLFIGEPSGICRTRDLQLHAAGFRRRGLSNAGTRHLDGRAVHHRRLPL
jgi:hypothetical protein